MDQPLRKLAPATGKPLIVLETADVRVVEYALQPSTSHSWHHHSEITDRFYCLEGRIEVQFRDPPRTERLSPGDSLAVAPGTVHRATNPADRTSRYLLVQGVGRYDFIKAP